MILKKKTLYIRYHYQTVLVEDNNKEIIPEVKLVSEAQPRDANNRRILSALAAIGRKHILMAQSVAEGPNYFKIRFKILKFGLIAANGD